MNRTSRFVALIAVLFVGSIGVGFVVGDEDQPTSLVASDVEVTTTTVVRPTTTTAPTTTTTRLAPTTTVRPTPTPRPLPSIVPLIPFTSDPPSTDPPITEPPTTVAPTTIPPTTAQPYDPVECATINRDYRVANAYDDPSRVSVLKSKGCPPSYWS